jgi:REP-associated tyrosine transposase
MVNHRAESESQLKLAAMWASPAAGPGLKRERNTKTMPFWRLHYHIVWATYKREPMITPEMESDLYGYLIGKAVAQEAIVHALNGIDNHIHVVASVPPKIAVATFIGLLKGSSSHHINHLPGAPGNFGWQDEYGVVSFGEGYLPRAIEYVEKQKEHHHASTLWEIFERTEMPDDQTH